MRRLAVVVLLALSASDLACNQGGPTVQAPGVPAPPRGQVWCHTPDVNRRDWASSECGPNETTARTTPITRTT